MNEGLRVVAKDVGGRGWQEVVTLEIHELVQRWSPVSIQERSPTHERREMKRVV